MTITLPLSLQAVTVCDAPFTIIQHLNCYKCFQTCVLVFSFSVLYNQLDVFVCLFGKQKTNKTKKSKLNPSGDS